MVEAEVSAEEPSGFYVLFAGSPPRVTFRQIMDAVCAIRGVSLAELVAPGKPRYAARSRQMVMWLADRLRPDLSLRTIARLLGRGDHTTVYHGIKTIDGQIQKGCPDTIGALVGASGRLGVERIDMTGQPRCRLTEVALAEREERKRRKIQWTTAQSTPG